MGIGVDLILAPRTRIPIWIRNRPNIIFIGYVQINENRNPRYLSIYGGDATFQSDGSVGVRMPGSSHFRVAFHPQKVFQIRDIRESEVISQNPFLCENCFELTGKVARPIPQITDYFLGHNQVYTLFCCSKCSYKWEVNYITSP